MPKPTFFNLPDEKRQAILDLAIAEFAQHDYKNASISRIVAQAGIAKGSFYQYFEDKQELYLYLIDLMAAEKMRLLQGEPPPDTAADIFALIRWLLRAGLNFEFANPQLAQIGYRALYGDAPLPTETRTAMTKGTLHYFQALVQQGVVQGVIAADIDHEAAAFIFSVIFTNLGDYLLKRQGGDPAHLLSDPQHLFATAEVEPFFEQILHILQRGMGVRA